ncbi:MAG: response regulator [Betaproteobacteria bacterium]|nr:response regulator [Betaproteobacteria bacterium]
MHPLPAAVQERDLYAVASAGTAELRGAGTALSSRELQILVLLDARTTVARIAERLNMPLEEALAVFSDLRRRGLIESATADSIAGIGDLFRMPLAPVAAAASAVQAGEEAGRGMSGLGRSGYYVTIARRRAVTQKPQEGRAYTVLVIDDDATITDLVQHYIEREGLPFRRASNREEIIAALRTRPVPDLALLDIMMPDADGFDVLARIRSHPVLKGMPVVMMSAVASREAVVKGLQLGADGYVTKPFTSESLMNAVRTVLGLARASR